MEVCLRVAAARPAPDFVAGSTYNTTRGGQDEANFAKSLRFFCCLEAWLLFRAGRRFSTGGCPRKSADRPHSGSRQPDEHSGALHGGDGVSKLTTDAARMSPLSSC